MKHRHIFLFGLLLTAICFSACSGNSTQADMPDDDLPVTTLQIDNMGATAYVLLSIEGEGATANLNEENAEITLRVGDRYSFDNVGGASNHPLNFRNDDQDKLLGQSNDEGIFDDDSEVNVQTDNNIISFTLTSALASELSGYVCSFHPGMNGEITTIE